MQADMMLEREPIVLHLDLQAAERVCMSHWPQLEHRRPQSPSPTVTHFLILPLPGAKHSNTGVYRGHSCICPGGTKNCLWIDGRQMRLIGRWKFIKGKGKPCVRMRCLILIEHVNQANQRGLLIAGLQCFDSWTLVVSLRRRKWTNDLGGQL